MKEDREEIRKQSQALQEREARFKEQEEKKISIATSKRNSSTQAQDSKTFTSAALEVLQEKQEKVVTISSADQKKPALT